MKGIILAGHGSYPSGLLSTIKMIAGDFPNVRLVEFKENYPLEDLEEDFRRAAKDLEEYGDLVVLTDLAGGTPFNRAVMTLGQRQNVRFLAGVNFALAYQAITSDIEDLDDFVKDVIEVAKDSILVYEDRQKEEENFEDGI